MASGDEDLTFKVLRFPIIMIDIDKQAPSADRVHFDSRIDQSLIEQQTPIVTSEASD